MPHHRFVLRAAMTLALSGVAVFAVGVGTASAHVETDPDSAVKGSYARVAFRVPNESPTDAGTIKLELSLPSEHPIASVSVRPQPGWTATTQKTKLDKPVKVMAEGATVDITEAVTKVTWQAQPGVRIGPGEFTMFEVLLGALPTDVDTLVMPVLQTYDDNSVVRWIEQPAAEGLPEPEHPAPVLKLTAAVTATAATAAAPTSGNNDDTARWLGGAGLVVGALGLVVSVGSLLRRRQPKKA